MPRGSRAEYMRDYRARKKRGLPPKTQQMGSDINPHEACDRRIAELQAEIKALKAKLNPEPVDDFLEKLF